MPLFEWRVGAMEDEKAALWLTFDTDDPQRRVQAVRYINLTDQPALVAVVDDAGNPLWSRTMPANTPDTGAVDIPSALRPALAGRTVQFYWPAPPATGRG